MFPFDLVDLPSLGVCSSATTISTVIGAVIGAALVILTTWHVTRNTNTKDL